MEITVNLSELNFFGRGILPYKSQLLNHPNSMKVIIIGSSSGIGLACARLFSKNNIEVIGISKSFSARGQREKFTQVLADVRNAEEIKKAVENAGKADALIYSAGVGLASPAAETKCEDYLDLFDVNFFGLCECVKHMLPHLSDNGKIIAISSMVSIFPVPYNAFYNSSKAAINSLVLSLSEELPRKITATAILPGGVRTEFSKKRIKYSGIQSDYDEKLSNSILNLTAKEQNGICPGKVAQALLDVLKSKNPPIFLPVGKKETALYSLEKFLPKNLLVKMLKARFTRNTKNTT